MADKRLGPIVDCWLLDPNGEWFRYYSNLSLTDPTDAAAIQHCLNKVCDGSDADGIAFVPRDYAI